MKAPFLFNMEKGVTLIELMVTIVIVIILATVALPSFISSIERQKLVGAAESVFADMMFARSQSIKTNNEIYINFPASVAASSTENWCYGLTDLGSATCDCTVSAAACTINGVSHVVSGDRYPGISMTVSSAEINFDPVRGTVNNPGNVSLQDSRGNQLHIKQHVMGRVRTCVASGYVGGYDAC